MSSIASRRQAIELWRSVENPLKEGENLAYLTMALLGTGKGREAQESSRAAVNILETQPPGKELALAYRNQAFLEKRSRSLSEARLLAEKSVALAERFGDARVLAMAYGTLGSNLLSLDFERGSEYLQRALKIAREAGLDARVATVYANLGSTACELHRFETASRYLSEGIAYCTERDLDMIRYYLLAWQSLTSLYLGDWRAAAEFARGVMEQGGVSARSRFAAVLALGRLRSRSGEGGTRELLTGARESGTISDQFEDVGPVCAALAEAAWLEGDPEFARGEARCLIRSDSRQAGGPGWGEKRRSGSGDVGSNRFYMIGWHYLSACRLPENGRPLPRNGSGWLVPMSKPGRWRMAKAKRRSLP